MTEQQHNALLDKMDAARKKWMDEEDDPDDGDRMLQDAIDMAVKNGKGWAPGEKEAYMKKILDDDYIPPMFCSTQEELEKTGLAEAFSSLQYDDDPAITMKDCKKKGAKAFMDGKGNMAKNIQYYRTAINHYYEAVAWASRIEPIEHRQAHSKGNTDKNDDDDATKKREATFEDYKEAEIDEMKSTLYSNAALCHIQLKNWGHAKTDSTKAVTFHSSNVKALYRLAKSNQMLKDWEPAGDAIDSGLKLDPANKDLRKLKKLLSDKIRLARIARQKRERIRSERASNIKAVWMHCKKEAIKLGRVALVASTSDELEYNEDLLVDDDQNEDAAAFESRWHHHFPHTGSLPKPDGGNNNGQPLWTWPCLFVYPSHSQSDFVKSFHEQEMLAERMAEMYPELEDIKNGGEGGCNSGCCSQNSSPETAMLWDYNNEFTCSNLAVYFEVNCPDGFTSQNNNNTNAIVHPDSVEPLRDMAATMKFYEASRALKGDEGPDIMKVAELIERKRLKKQRKAWKKKHKTLAKTPDPTACVRVHPAMTLEQILKDPRMVVANFLVTLLVIPDKHPAHEAYLKEHKCVGVLQPEGTP
jgi:tetratricopeptide (TPR) repeat protein